jgi:CRISPR/Cas system-associated exonuclease Cas4 (RecB family)
MTLPRSFQFSQNSLQDYEDCPRRFQLRYLLMQPWPALITDQPAKAERHRERAAALHRLAHQAALGIDPAQLQASIQDAVLADWWGSFRASPPPGVPTAQRHPEVMLAATLAGFRLVGKFDLLAVAPGEQLVIVDWKAMLKKPSRTSLARRLQTRVYRYLAVAAGSAFNAGLEPRPDQVEMVYWFATHAGHTERFPYDAEQHQAGRQFLDVLISEIAGRDEPVWPLTPDKKRCSFCNFRSLCQRGVKAGFYGDLDDDIEPDVLDIDLEQIAEIAF